MVGFGHGLTAAVETKENGINSCYVEIGRVAKILISGGFKLLENILQFRGIFPSGGVTQSPYDNDFYRLTMSTSMARFT